MIIEDYVSFETAKLLKEKGFNEKCISTYNLVTGIFEVEEVYQDWTTRWKAYVSAPTLQMAMKWLREVHKLEITVLHEMLQGNAWWYRIEKNTGLSLLVEKEEDAIYTSYEDACEAGIKYVLENLV